jgi:hypothetical protein
MALVAGVLLLVSCGSPHGAANATTVPAIVGDSNVLLATGALSLTFFNRNDTFPVVVIARVGSGIRFTDCSPDSKRCATNDYWKVRLGDVLRRVHPDAYVVNLGVNDTAQLGTATTQGYAGYENKIDYFLALLGNRPVLWTNLPCRIEPKQRLVGCNAVNAALASAPSRHRNLTVLDWAQVANAHPEWMAAFAGGVHYTASGYAAWSSLVANELDARFKPSG